jgi:hypothetical protein
VKLYLLVRDGDGDLEPAVLIAAFTDQEMAGVVMDGFMSLGHVDYYGVRYSYSIEEEELIDHEIHESS